MTRQCCGSNRLIRTGQNQCCLSFSRDKIIIGGIHNGFLKVITFIATSCNRSAAFCFSLLFGNHCICWGKIMTVFSACCFICSLRQDSLFKNRHRARDSASHDGSLPFAHLSIHGSPSNTFRTTLTGMLPISLSRGRNGSIKPLKR